MIKSVILFFIISSNLIYCNQICYEGLGCFISSYPFSGTWRRPLASLPQDPEELDVKFTLYNRNLINTSEIISVNNISSNFKPTLRTKILIHGFLQNANRKWVLNMKNEILRAENVNVITVDWRKGSGFPYLQAVANSQLVGAELSRLISKLSNGTKSEHFHLIGHSLGAHIAGYTGQRIKNIGRITGLDPARLYFEETDPRVRLDPTDALYVDVIHTDTSYDLGLGLGQRVGHADYYVNGGEDQPECPSKTGKIFTHLVNHGSFNFDGIEKRASCSHLAAIYYFIDSINSKCKYTSFSCNSKSDFESGNCLKCSSKGCNRMGYWSSPLNELGTLYLKTQSPLGDSFCRPSYVVTLISNSKLNTSLVEAKGNITIYLETSDGNSTREIFDDSITIFRPDLVETRLISFNGPLSDKINSVYLSYDRMESFFGGWFYDKEWSFKNIEIFDSEIQKTSKFCPTKNMIGPGEIVKFSSC